MLKNPKGTVLITGASSGIGEAYARKLAEQGYNLVLVARRKDKLETIAQELKEKYSAVVEIICADLSKDEDIQKVEQRILEISDLTMLINNAGFGTTGRFAEVEKAKHIEMINVHISASLRLCRAALPAMINMNAGVIINVSSIAAMLPNANRVNYCATKAYLNMFSKSLQREVAEYNIKVQVLCPGYTLTGFHDTENFKDWSRSEIPKKLWMTAEEVVAISLKALKSKKVVCIPGFKYRLLICLMNSKLLKPLGNLLIKTKSRKKK